MFCTGILRQLGLDSVERLLNVFPAVTESDWATVRATGGVFGLGEFCKEPFHAAGLQRHVDFYRGVAREGGSDSGAEGSEIF